MSRELDCILNKIDRDIRNARDNADASAGKIEDHLTQVADEYHRVTQLSGQAGYVLDQLDRDFKAKTKLSNRDIVLLFLCTALQCARQYLLTNKLFTFQDIKGKASSQLGDLFMERTVGKAVEIVKPEWNEVLFQPVPYDAIKTGVHITDSTGISGTTHRYRTLGHDPVLGWIFGTANIMTNSLTKFDFETFQVKEMQIIRHYPLGVVGMLNRAVSYAQKDSRLLAAAVARQAIHFGSDMFTKQGLPVPLIATINNDLAKNMMTKWNINAWSVLRGAGLAAFFNQLIFCIHQLFYQEERDGSPSMYEVRTRKILSYSNALATGSNVIVVAFTEDVSKFDVGGMLVTIHRLVSDYQFIHEVKRDFLKNEFYKKVVGDQYDFMEGN